MIYKVIKIILAKVITLSIVLKDDMNSVLKKVALNIMCVPE